MKLVVDMNLSPRWADYLQDAGFDAEHWSCIGSGRAPDREIVEYARANSRVILTQDLDFGILLALGGLSTPSVVQVRAQAVLPSDIGPQLAAALNATATYLEQGALVTFLPGAHRVAVLPIAPGR